MKKESRLKKPITEQQIAFADRLRNKRLESQLSLQEVAEKIGISKVTLSRYETLDITNIPSDKIEELARVYKTTPAYLMGWSTEINLKADTERKIVIPSAQNIRPIELTKLPIIGKIAAGRPILAQENIEGYANMADGIHADFCLQVQGDSMINARIYDGDIVFIKQQPEVEDGEIAAVLIDDSATLKRFYHNDGTVTLMPENPKYKPIVCTKDNCTEFKILGKAVAFQSMVR